MSLTEQVRTCRDCNLYKKCRKRVPGVGHPKATVMVVGAAPDFDDDREGSPFVGQVGQMLTACLMQAGVNLNQVYFTHSVKCHPGKGDPPAYAWEACRKWLKAEHNLVDPKLTIAVGAVAMRRLGVSGGINQNSGSIFYNDEWGYVMPVVSPGSFFKHPTDVPKLITQLHGVNTFLAGGMEPPPYTPSEEVWNV